MRQSQRLAVFLVVNTARKQLFRRRGLQRHQTIRFEIDASTALGRRQMKKLRVSEEVDGAEEERVETGKNAGGGGSGEGGGGRGRGGSRFLVVGHVCHQLGFIHGTI